MQHRSVLASAIPFLVATSLGCRAFERGPSSEEIVALVKASPPAPPTVGPTYMAEVDDVQVQERGDYEARSQHWPVRVRVRGLARIKLTNVFHLGLVDDTARAKTQRVEFVEVARLSKDSFGAWKVAYDYSNGPEWRLKAADPRTATGQEP